MGETARDRYSVVQLNTPEGETARDRYSVVQLNTPMGETARDRYSVVQLNTTEGKCYGTNTAWSNETPKRTNSTGQTQHGPIKCPDGETL